MPCVVRFEAPNGEGHVAWPRVASTETGMMVDDFMLASNREWERVDKANERVCFDIKISNGNWSNGKYSVNDE